MVPNNLGPEPIILILTEYQHPYIIDSIEAPIVPKFFWTFNGMLSDFVLTPLLYLESTTGPSVTIEINGFAVTLPATWNILISDEATKSVDTVALSDCTSRDFDAVLVYSNTAKVDTAKIKIIDLQPKATCVHPEIPKAQLMCHPVGTVDNSEYANDHLSIVVGPYDLYKYVSALSLKDLVY
jgi:hypothetical protein